MISGKKQKKIVEFLYTETSFYKIAKKAKVDWHTAKKYTQKFRKQACELSGIVEKSISAENDSFLKRIPTRIFGSGK